MLDKKARYEGYAALKKKFAEALSTELGAEKYLANEKLIKAEFEERKATVVRTLVLDKGKRIDGRDTKTVRPIMCEAGLLPRVHGSALFQRGETQAIVTTTLGTSTDEQKIDGLMGETWKRFYLHYNFPFSTGETKPMRGPGRREIGHGALAERALVRMIPAPDKFPTPSASSARRWSRTAPRRWRRSAAAASRSWTPASRSRARWLASPWA